MALVYCYGETPPADALAKETAEILTYAYPNHSWWIECRGGALIIKHFEVSGARGLVCMVRHTSQLDADAGARKRDVVRAAGELLERAGLRRGARTSDPVRGIELDDPRMKAHWHTPFPMSPVHE